MEKYIFLVIGLILGMALTRWYDLYLFKKGADEILYRLTKDLEGRQTKSQFSYTKYDDNYDKPRAYPNIIISDREEAEKIVDKLQYSTDLYGVFTVADLYDFACLEHGSFAKQFGWKDYNIDGSIIKKVKEGYLINLKKYESLEEK